MTEKRDQLMLTKNIEDKLKKHSKFHKKLMSFSDLESFELFEIEYVIETYFNLKKSLPYLKINILNYNNFKEFYKSVHYISDERKKSFFDLTLKEKKVFLTLKNICFEMVNEYLIIKPKNYQEAKLVSSDNWCIKEEKFYNIYHKNNKRLLVSIKEKSVIGITYSDKSVVAFNYNDDHVFSIDKTIIDKFNLPSFKIQKEPLFDKLYILTILTIIPTITFIFDLKEENYRFLDSILTIGGVFFFIGTIIYYTLKIMERCNIMTHIQIISVALIVLTCVSIKSSPENTLFEILYKNDSFSMINPIDLKERFDKENILSYLTINQDTTYDNFNQQILNLQYKYRFLNIKNKNIYFKILEEAYEKGNSSIKNYLINNIHLTFYEKELNELIIKFNDINKLNMITNFDIPKDMNTLIKYTVENNDVLLYYMANMDLTNFQLISYKGVALYYKNNEIVEFLNKKIENSKS
jgi:hypothetical protein